MRKPVSIILLTVATLIIAFILAGCSSGFKPAGKETSPATVSGTNAPPPASLIKSPTNGLIQSNDANAVTIDVKWARASNGSLVFDVVMDTHSVDLDQYDLKKLALLRDDTGSEYRPSIWSAPNGGHHRQGTLTFPLPDSVTQGKAKYIEMVIKDVAGVKERALKWEL